VDCFVPWAPRKDGMSCAALVLTIFFTFQTATQWTSFTAVIASEGKQSIAQREEWIGSSLALLAMTFTGRDTHTSRSRRAVRASLPYMKRI
jgi:hypothetical protein